MTQSEKDAKLAELERLSNELRDAIQQRTQAARKLHDENKALMEQRQQVRHALHALQHVKVDDGPEN